MRPPLLFPIFVVYLLHINDTLTNVQTHHILFDAKCHKRAAKKRRHKILERATKEKPAFRLTPRDIQIVEACWQYRALSTNQIQKLFFPNSNNNSATTQARHRLKLLYHHGYLYRDEQVSKLSYGRLPLVYFLDRAGAELIKAQRGISQRELGWNPRYNASGAGHYFLRHLLKTNDIRASVAIAASQKNVPILRWIDDKKLRSKQMKTYVALKQKDGEETKAAVVPDGFCELEWHGRHFTFFIEADLRTVTGVSSIPDKRDWVKKIRIYQEFYDSRLFQQRYRAPSFRVLTVTTGDQRLANLKAITEANDGRNRFWFTTFAQIESQDALTAPIWQIASREGDFALIESPFE